MKDVYPTESKITTTNVSTMETTISKLSTLSITGRVSELGQHLQILQTAHPHSDPTTDEITFFQWHVTIQQMHPEKPLTLVRGGCQLAHQNSQDHRCKGHQEKCQPAYKTQTQQHENIGTCNLYSKHHQICHTSQQTNTSMQSWKWLRGHTMISPYFSAWPVPLDTPLHSHHFS